MVACLGPFTDVITSFFLFVEVVVLCIGNSVLKLLHFHNATVLLIIILIQHFKFFFVFKIFIKKK